MPENDIDLWPSDLGLDDIPQSPVSILRQQANTLSSKLDNKIQAKVFSAPIEDYDGSTSRNQGITIKLRHTMVLIVPALENYELDLLNLSHGDETYPVLARLKDEDRVRLDDEEALMDWLRKAFASKTTRRALSSLLSLAT